MLRRYYTDGVMLRSIVVAGNAPSLRSTGAGLTDCPSSALIKRWASSVRVARSVALVGILTLMVQALSAKSALSAIVSAFRSTKQRLSQYLRSVGPSECLASFASLLPLTNTLQPCKQRLDFKPEPSPMDFPQICLSPPELKRRLL